MNPATALVQPDNPVLWKPAQKVEPDEMELAVETATNMYTVMIAKDGAGLAAPQVNISKTFFIRRTEKHFEIFINPEIIEFSKEKKTDWEGCLSLPDFRITVRRHVWIVVRYFNGKETVEKKFRKTAARVILHELDHLNGICVFSQPKSP